MKTFLLAAVVALAPAAETKPLQCQIVIHYMSDEPGKINLDLPKTEPCGLSTKEEQAIHAALRTFRGEPR